MPDAEHDRLIGAGLRTARIGDDVRAGRARQGEKRARTDHQGSQNAHVTPPNTERPSPGKNTALETLGACASVTALKLET